MLRTLSHLFLGIASQLGAQQDVGQVVVVLDASTRMTRTVGPETTFFKTVGDAVVKTVVSPPDELSRVRVGLRFAGGEPPDESARPCVSTTLAIPPAEVLPEHWRRIVAGRRPHGECPLIRSVLAALGDLEASPPPSRLVVVTAGGDDCGGTREEVVRELAGGHHVIDLRIVGILLPPETVAFFEGVPLRNVANPDDLEMVLRWALFEGHRAEQPAIPEAPSASLECPSSVIVGEPVQVRWSGPDAAEDFISLALPEDPGNAYVSWERTEIGNPIVMNAPEKPGVYEIRYVSGIDAEVLTRSPVEVSTVAIELQVPPTVAPEQRFEIRWTGSTAPGDFIAVSRPNAPPDRMMDWASTATGSPATLAAPARPGDYEVRFIRKLGLEILARAPVEVMQ